MLRIVAIVLAALVSVEAFAESQQSPQTPQVKTENKAERPEKDKTDTKQSPEKSVSVVSANTKKENPNSNRGHGADEGTEFWPALNGYRMKVTDSLLVLFTFVLAIFTGLLYCMARKQDEATKTIERAYVKMSHTPPGLNIEQASAICWVRLNVKNYGRTPASVIELFIKWRVLPNNETLPETPDYTEGTRITPNTFLVTQDEFFYPYSFFIRPIPALAPIDSGKELLYLYGYVRYVDAFGQHHQSGYARAYNPLFNERNRYPTDEAYAKRSNLEVVSQNGYNYDRPPQGV